jgi:putative endonuclease
MLTRAELGRAAEAFVADYLEREGYRVIERNFRVAGGEIDIIALDGNVLVFVEVRARTGARVVEADETVDARKLKRLMLAADWFLQTRDGFMDHLWRVDLVAITLDHRGSIRRFNHYDNLTLDE